MEGLLAETYRNRVPYELLQNSDDAGSDLVTQSNLGGGRFRWTNDGRAPRRRGRRGAVPQCEFHQDPWWRLDRLSRHRLQVAGRGRHPYRRAFR